MNISKFTVILKNIMIINILFSNDNNKSTLGAFSPQYHNYYRKNHKKNALTMKSGQLND